MVPSMKMVFKLPAVKFLCSTSVRRSEVDARQNCTESQICHVYLKRGEWPLGFWASHGIYLVNAKPTNIMVLDERQMWPLEIDTVLLVSL